MISTPRPGADPSAPPVHLDLDAPTGVAAVPGGAADGAAGIRGPLRRLLVSLPTANFVINLVWGAVPSVLLALQVQRLGEVDKVAHLALITTVGGMVSLLSQPIAGVLSDHTRSRFGKRTPWIVLGALVGGLSLIGMSAADTLAQLAVGWVCIIIGFNFAQGPLSAVLPDRVPRAVRGVFAAGVGMGMMLGSMGGQIFGSAMSANIPLAYWLLAGVALLGIGVFVAVNREQSTASEQRRPLALRRLLGTFWVNPVRHPDFAWAFTGRLMMYTGYNVVFGYKLYVLQDYIGLGADAVRVLPVLGALAIAGLLSTTMIAGRLSDRVGRRKIFVIVSGLVVAGALLIPLFVPTTLGMLLMAGIGGMGYGCFQAVDTALITEVLPDKESFGKDIGVVNMAATLPQILAPSLAAMVVVLSGGYEMLFPLGALCAAAAVIPVSRVKGVR